MCWTSCINFSLPPLKNKVLYITILVLFFYLILPSFQNFRRIPPVSETPDELDKESPVFNSVSDEAEAKRLKSETDITTENICDATDSSEWKWSISDFRKEHSENFKEQLDGSNERSKDSNEHSNNLEQLSNGSKEALNSSKESSNNLEYSKECVKNSMESSEVSKEPVRTCKENGGISKEFWESLKPESHLRNPPQVLRNEAFQDWKLPVRSLKEPSSYVKLHSPQLNSNTSVLEKNGEVRNESQNDNMPVILNVFSLSKDPAKQFTSNTKQENSVLFTPPCSPPYVQLGPFGAAPVTNQNPRFRNEFMNQAAFQQGRQNWYKPVQQVYQNFQEYSSNPLQQVRSQNKPVQQVYYNYQEYLSYPVKQGSSQGYLTKPVQQVYSNFQEIYPKQVQQVASQDYLNKPVKQVYYNYHENWSYPVQQVNSQEYLNKPVQQVYYNPPPGYLSKPVQSFNSQEYLNHSVQQTNPPEYLPNLAQKVNPVNPQDYAYNPVRQNPHQIANGVLPLEKQRSNQNMYESQFQPNTTQFYTQRYVDSKDQPAPQLKSILSDGQLVERGHSMAKGNGVYARFKLTQSMVESNTESRQSTEGPPQFYQIPAVQDASNIGSIYSGVPISNRENVSSTAVMFPNTLSTVQNGVNTPPNYSNGVYAGKYRTDYGCSAVLDGYGKNKVLCKNSDSPTNNTTYNMKQSEDPFATPTMISEKQSVYSENSFCSSTIYIPGSTSVSGEQGKDSPREFLSPRDAKVIELKQRLEEQEATLEKLRANH